MTNGRSGKEAEKYAANKRRLLEIYEVEPEMNRVSMDPYDVHHIILRSEGGGDDMGNLALTKRSDHERTHRMIVQRDGYT